MLLQVERIIAEREDGKLPIGSSDKERPTTIFETILDCGLPPHEKTAPRLTDEGFVMAVAGGDDLSNFVLNRACQSWAFIRIRLFSKTRLAFVQSDGSVNRPTSLDASTRPF
jgi:hypothetical protein